MPRGGNNRIIGEDDVFAAAQLLAYGVFKHQIRDQMRQRGITNARTFERCLARARILLRSGMEGDIADHLSSALAVYRRILRDAETPPRDKLRAQERIDTLLGLEKAHAAIAPADADGNGVNAPLVRPALPPGAIPPVERPGPIQVSPRWAAVGENGIG